MIFHSYVSLPEGTHPKVSHFLQTENSHLCRTRNRAARTSAGHIVVVNEEVVLGAHAAEEFGHVVSKQEGRLARGPRAAVRSNTPSGVPRKKQPTRGEC